MWKNKEFVDIPEDLLKKKDGVKSSDIQQKTVQLEVRNQKCKTGAFFRVGLL